MPVSNNDILPEYTALICARSGRLAEALALPEPDDALIAGAGVILSALLATRGGSPADGMEAFEDGPRALEGYLRVLAGRRLSMEQFMLLRRIADFLQDDELLKVVSTDVPDRAVRQEKQMADGSSVEVLCGGPTHLEEQGCQGEPEGCPGHGRGKDPEPISYAVQPAVHVAKTSF
ncbi:MAG: hypothetical protein P8Z74_12705 [Acidobacteriota bacterium]